MSGAKSGEERRGAMVGDRDERRGSIGTLGTNWIGASEKRMRRRGHKKIIAPSPAELRAGLRFRTKLPTDCFAGQSFSTDLI